MIKILARQFLIASISLGSVIGCNYKILDSEAHRLNSKLSMHQQVSTQEIKESFRFVYNEENIAEEYKNPTKFDALCEKAQQESKGCSSKVFIENCLLIYKDSSSSLQTKISVHLLLDKVREKYVSLIKLIEMHEKALQEEVQTTTRGSSEEKDIFRAFSDHICHDRQVSLTAK